MSIVDFIAVVSLTCFGIGYSFGKDNNKTQKQPPMSKRSSYFCLTLYRTNRLSAVPISNTILSRRIVIVKEFVEQDIRASDQLT